MILGLRARVRLPKVHLGQLVLWESMDADNLLTERRLRRHRAYSEFAGPAPRHVSTGTLDVLAARLGSVFASTSTCMPRVRVHPQKLKVGTRPEKLYRRRAEVKRKTGTLLRPEYN